MFLNSEGHIEYVGQEAVTGRSGPFYGIMRGICNQVNLHILCTFYIIFYTTKYL